MNNFIFIGGDLRSVYAAAELNKYFDCCIYGFDKTEFEPPVPTLRNLQRRKSVVLPLPVSKDAVNINAPYSEEILPIAIIEEAAEKNAVIYTSKVFPALETLCSKNGYTLINYFDREELAVLNAVPTAEGAIETAMRELPFTLFQSQILITGYGRIAKVLSRYLRCMGANVTVSARSCADLANAEIMGCAAVRLYSDALSDMLPNFDLIFNTVPASVFDNRQLMKIRKDALIIDLASKSGIEDLELAGNVGLNVIRAMSLPGKTAPVTAGKIIAKTLLNIIEEESENDRNTAGRN